MSFMQSDYLAIKRWRRGALFALAAIAISVNVMAQDNAAMRRSAADWLNRIQRAAQQQHYEGTFVYQRDAFVQSSRITHYVVRGEGEYERIESLDGKPRTLLRHNDDLYTFVPERRLCVIERRQNKDAFPALLGAKGEAVSDVYRLTLREKDRVAGREAQVIELIPIDSYRFAYKLWADLKTGLLLRSQILNADQRVLEQISFTQLSMDIPALNGARSIASEMRNLDNWTIARPPLTSIDIASQGWRIEPAIAGFHKIREVWRPMASREAGAPSIPVDQVVFTDGLATVSIFIEPSDNATRKEGAGNDGATHVLVKRRDGFWITALGEVPSLSLQKFISAVAYDPSK